MLYHLMAILVILVWGVSFVSTKVLLGVGLHPTEIYIYRFTLAYALVLLICHNKIKANTWRDEFIFMAMGLCAGTIYYLGENFALQYTLVTNVSLLSSTSPLLTLLLIGLIYKSQRPRRGVIWGSMLALTGAALVIFNGSLEMKVNPLGDFLAICCSISWAIYSIFLKKVDATYTTIFITRKTFFYGVLFALPFLALEPKVTPISVLFVPDVFLNLLFLTLVCSVLGFYGWAWVVNGLGAIKANNYLYFQPVVTMIVGALVLGEAITLMGVGGCICILVGVWLGDYLSRR